MMRLLTLVAILAALAAPASRAQLVVDTARGIVGEEVALAIRLATPIDSTAALTLRGSFHLSNATVFHPERFIGAARTRVESFRLVRLTDSTYDFRVDMTLPDGVPGARDTLFLLAGEALAGFDSVCVVSFSALSDEDSIGRASGVIVTRSVGTPLPYVRRATLEPGYPNPARRYQRVTWGFRIDKESPVRFGIYNLAGELIADHDRGVLPPGIYLETFEVGFDVATGAYLVALSTNSGDAWQWMHVVK